MKRAVLCGLLLLLTGCGGGSVAGHPAGRAQDAPSFATPPSTRAADWPVPDDALTPGAVVPNCTYPVSAERTVTDAVRKQVRDEYHYTGPVDLAHLEIDHRVPHSICGSDDIKNLWAEVTDGVKEGGFTWNHKDDLERVVATRVRLHQITLAVAQKLFLGDWRVSWCNMVHVAGDGIVC